jgi:hypothetical protein
LRLTCGAAKDPEHVIRQQPHQQQRSSPEGAQPHQGQDLSGNQARNLNDDYDSSSSIVAALLLSCRSKDDDGDKASADPVSTLPQSDTILHKVTAGAAVPADGCNCQLLAVLLLQSRDAAGAWQPGITSSDDNPAMRNSPNTASCLQCEAMMKAHKQQLNRARYTKPNMTQQRTQ